jgi:hypothetical protein
MAVFRQIKVDEIVASGVHESSDGLKEFVRRASQLSLNCLLHIAPIVVVDCAEKFKLVAGHKSFLAARALLDASEKVPVLCIEPGDTELSQHLETVNRLFGHLFHSSDERPDPKEWAKLTAENAGVFGRDLSIPTVRNAILKDGARKRAKSESESNETLVASGDLPRGDVTT